MTNFIWISRGNVATLVDEIKQVLFGGSETAARKLHAAAAQDQSGAQCVLKKLQPE